MMKLKAKYSILLFVISLFLLCSVPASARTGFQNTTHGIRYYNDYGNLVKGTWFVKNGNYYYANSTGYLATGLTTINDKLYYFLSDGRNATGWRTIQHKRYYFMKKTKEAIQNKMYTFIDGQSYLFDAHGWRLKGLQKVGNYRYYFDPSMMVGWIENNGHFYYFIESGSNKGRGANGLRKIDGIYRYFDSTTGIMATSTTKTVNGTKYRIDEYGVCTPVVTTTDKDPSVKEAPSAKMLFFLSYESGSEAYNQTGGDNGNACGAYQFDYRYSLLDFIKFAYNKNKTLCAEFERFAAFKDTTANRNKLKSNKKLYKAWHTIYKRNSKLFSSYQDIYAKEQYYDVTERYLLNAGIDVRKRPDVVKGAIYSYSIQHGQLTAANAVKAIKATPAMTDKAFLRKLYNYRKKHYSYYSTRYTQEYQDALSLL